MSDNIQPVTIFNRKVYPFKNETEVVDFIRDKKGILIAVGGEKLMNNNSKLVEIINNNYAYCDGYAAQYAVRHRGYPQAPKIPGAYLWRTLIAQLSKETKYYIFGAKEEVYQDVIQKLNKDYPGIKIVGGRNGYFKPEEEGAILEDIKSSGADVVFVALGSPKQEYLMDRYVKEYPALYMGLGGSFDLYTNRVRPVPKWWNKIFKWEGLYRQLMDFRNLKRWKRQMGAFPLIFRLLSGKY